MTDEKPRGRREPQTLAAWETWVDKLIRDAQERGEFDDLPGQGKPLQIEEAPYAGGLEVGYGLLKNANVAPIWIELGREIDAAEGRLAAIRERAMELSRLPERDEPVHAAEPDRRPWWVRWFVGAPAPEPIPAVSERASREIVSLRREYLETAKAIDERIAQYNATIPRELWHLERVRVSREQAERDFPVATGGR